MILVDEAGVGAAANEALRRSRGKRRGGFGSVERACGGLVHAVFSGFD